MEIHQEISEDDYRTVFVAHLRRHQIVRFRPLIALLNAVYGIVLLIVLDDSFRFLGFVLIALGLYISVKTNVQVWRSMKLMRTSKLYEKPTRIEINEDCIRTECGDSSGRFAFADLLGFHLFPKGILIYLQKNQFIPLLSRHLEAPLEIDQVSARLREAGLAELTQRHNK